LPARSQAPQASLSLGNLPAAIDGAVTVMHTNDIHGSYKYSYNASKGTGTVGFRRTGGPL
jgi:hypothetical protein